jgi:Tol biopolymer transport system component
MSGAASWERVRAVFHAAVEEPVASRAAFLARACAGNDDLRREVESLLAAADAAPGFLEGPVIDVGADRGEAPPELQPGDRIGNFEVIDSLGAGGMGEVYRARDTTLRREVAVKLLPRAMADDHQRLARFERESRILAAMNHAHIAAIHSVEHADGRHALVMELVEGPTLADRVKRGALEWRDALAVARDLADALEAAHDKGVVHRDLKPANIKFSSSGSLKLLDFGLAKEHGTHEPAGAGSTPLPADALKTSDGWIFGTCAYMSPEQARGLPVDKRTDIWAFGCLLFEMLTGRRAFAGETVAATIAAVLDRDPDWAALPGVTPPPVRRLLRRCLEKDPYSRLHDIADARIEIDEALQADESSPSGGDRTRARLVSLALLGALTVGAVALGWWLRARAADDSPAARLARSTWSIGAGAGLTSARGAPPRLFVRPLSALEARPIVGTEGASHPFWSPDSRTVAYFVPGKLMKVAIDGGAPVAIAAARGGRGGTWSSSGIIVFSPDLIDAALVQVPAEGGTPQPATRLDTSQGENAHRWPVFLPDGVHFLYFVRSVRPERRGVYVGRIDRAASTPGDALFHSESEALHASFGRAGGGVLLSTANGHIEVRRFDADRLRTIGDPTTVDIPAAAIGLYHASMFSVSADVLAYVTSPIPYGRRLVSTNRTGGDARVWPTPEVLNWPRLSPDGRRLAYQRLDPVGGGPDLLVEDLERGSRFRVTREGHSGLLPVWSPDGRRISFVTGAVDNPSLVIGAADATGTPSTVPCPGARCLPTDWSSDGQWLVANVLGPSGADVWLLPAMSDGTARPLLAAPFVERDARLSPDGSLVAYVSEESGRPEVTVQTVGGAAARDVLSAGGGDQPVWGRGGHELFFVDPKGLLRSVTVSGAADGRPAFGRTVPLGVPPIGVGHLGTQYDVSPDGRFVYHFDGRIDPPPSEINIVLGWRALLRSRE